MSFLSKKTDLPPFWHNYEKKFEEDTPTEIDKLRFVVLDTETTGFDYKEDRILCIGALTLVGNTILVNQSLEIYLQQEKYSKETVKIHGILKKGTATQVTEFEALEKLLVFLGNAVLVAHHAYFDLKMINTALKRNGLPKLKNTILDTSTLYKKTLLSTHLLEKKEIYSLDELADKFDISKKDRHTALGDAYITAIAFLKILARLKKKNNLTTKSLLNYK